MENEVNLISQTVDLLIKSAISIEYYGKELATLDDVASVLNTLDCNRNRKKPITANGLKVAKYKLKQKKLLEHYEPEWENLFEKG
jgi:hypothetical protein